MLPCVDRWTVTDVSGIVHEDSVIPRKSLTFLGLCDPEDEDITIPEASVNLLGLSYSER